MTEARTYMDGYSDGKEWAKPSQAQPEPKGLNPLWVASHPDGLRRAQPEPSYTAIHSEHCFQPPYETSCKYGDSDCPASYKEQRAQPERAPSDDPLQGAADWFLQADGEFFCVATVQRTLRIGYNRAQRLCDIAKERAAHGIKQGGQHD